MSITSSNYTDIGYVEEVTPGTTPASPNFQILPTTGGSPSGNITTTVSEVIRSDRQIDDLVVTDADIGGDVNFELSYAPYKPIMEALMQSTSHTVAFNDDDIQAAAADNSFNTVAGSFITAGIVVGDVISVAGFSNAANNGRFIVTSVAALKIVVVSPTGATLVNEDLTGGSAGTIDSVAIRNGAATPKSYTFRKFVDGITNPGYFYYTGCQISKMMIEFTTGAILTGQFSIVGREEEVTETQKSGEATTDVPAYTVMNSVTSVSATTLGGLTGATSYSSLSLTIDNNINAAKAIGTLGAADLASFTLNVTGDMTLYFEDIDMYNFYKNSSSFYVYLEVVDGDGNRIVLYMPKVKFESVDTPIDGKDSFFMANSTIRALRDATYDYTVGFYFFPAP